MTESDAGPGTSKAFSVALSMLALSLGVSAAEARNEADPPASGSPTSEQLKLESHQHKDVSSHQSKMSTQSKISTQSKVSTQSKMSTQSKIQSQQQKVEVPEEPRIR